MDVTMRPAPLWAGGIRLPLLGFGLLAAMVLALLPVSSILAEETASFGNQTAFTTGSGAFSVAIGDLNGDGKPDLAVANLSSANVSVLLGDGAGSFGAKTDFAVGTGPRSVAIGDFNGDEKPDLATANDSDNVSVLLSTTSQGATTPTFATKTDYTTGTNSYAVRIGDLNGDGKPDLVTANLSSSNASVILNGGVTNTAPEATAQSVTTNEDTAKAITLAGTDADTGDTLTFSVVTNPTKGSLSGTAPNLTYTPTANANGADSFTFKANDGTADSATATVTITVTAVNNAPTANALSASTTEDVPVSITLSGTDVEGSTLTFSIVTQPTHGQVQGTPPNVTYLRSNRSFTGIDTFTYKANDGTDDGAAATVSVTINAAPPPPITVVPEAQITLVVPPAPGTTIQDPSVVPAKQADLKWTAGASTVAVVQPDKTTSVSVPGHCATLNLPNLSRESTYQVAMTGLDLAEGPAGGPQVLCAWQVEAYDTNADPLADTTLLSTGTAVAQRE